MKEKVIITPETHYILFDDERTPDYLNGKRTSSSDCGFIILDLENVLFGHFGWRHCPLLLIQTV